MIQEPLTYPHPQVWPDDGQYRCFVRGGVGGHLVHVAKGNRFLCVPGHYLFKTDIVLEAWVKITCKECARRWLRTN